MNTPARRPRGRYTWSRSDRRHRKSNDRACAGAYVSSSIMAQERVVRQIKFAFFCVVPCASSASTVKLVNEKKFERLSTHEFSAKGICVVLRSVLLRKFSWFPHSSLPYVTLLSWVLHVPPNCTRALFSRCWSEKETYFRCQS